MCSTLHCTRDDEQNRAEESDPASSQEISDVSDEWANGRDGEGVGSEHPVSILSPDADGNGRETGADEVEDNLRADVDDAEGCDCYAAREGPGKGLAVDAILVACGWGFFDVAGFVAVVVELIVVRVLSLLGHCMVFRRHTERWRGRK